VTEQSVLELQVLNFFNKKNGLREVGIIMKKWLIIMAIFLMISTVTGCFQQKPADPANPNQTQQDAESKKEGNTDPDLTAKLKSEQSVLSGRIYEREGLVIGTIIMEKGTTTEVAQALAQKYLEEIKIQYPGKEVNVQVVADDNNLANLNFQP